MARHYPPLVSGGSRRPYSFVRILAQAGFDVTVMSPAAPVGVDHVCVPHHYPEARHGSVHHLNEKSVRFRDHLLLPDPDISWALKCLRTRLPFRPDLVLTTSPPESVHLVGRVLKRRYGCSWVADFRDHWCAASLLPVRAQYGFRRSLERRLARYWLRPVDAVIAAGPSIAGEIARYGQQMKSAVIPNTSLAPAPPDNDAIRLDRDRINLVHTGAFSLSDPGRRLESVLEALEAVRADKLCLHLVGPLTAAEIARVESSARVSQIQIHGPVSMQHARAIQAAADVLLLVAAHGSPHLPGKLTEYIAAGKPILAVGEGAWASEAGLHVARDLAAVFSRLNSSDELPYIAELNRPVAPGEKDGATALIRLISNLIQ